MVPMGCETRRCPAAALLVASVVPFRGTSGRAVAVLVAGLWATS